MTDEENDWVAGTLWLALDALGAEDPAAADARLGTLGSFGCGRRLLGHQR